MTTTVPTGPAAAPVLQKNRIVSIDVIRGVAVLGILLLNIQSFAMISAAYMNPTAFPAVPLEGTNYVIWYVNYLLCDQKFMTIFSLLFGAGIALMTARAEARTGRSAAVHYRRMGWLILFGVLHAHLLWFGDILYTYGMCGLVVWLFRTLPAGILIVLGLGSIGVGSLVGIGLGFMMETMPADQAAQQAQGWAPDAETIRKEVDAYRGGWLDQVPHRSKMALVFQTIVFLFFISWKAGGLMLLGMGLFKLGYFSARLSSLVYTAVAALGLGFGLTLVRYGIQQNFEHAWAWSYSQSFGMQWNYWGSLLVSLAYVALVMLACKAEALATLLRPLAAVGQMALTNYLMQTIICTTIFYGHGFGLFGSVDRLQMMYVVAGVWAVQLAWSPLWMKHFRFGPFEWLWRSLTYWRLQPFRRRAVEPAVDPGSPGDRPPDGGGDAPVDNLRDVARR